MKLNCQDNTGFDLKKHFEEASALIHEEKKKGGRVFIHCIAGVSRSPALTIAYLIRHEGNSRIPSVGLVWGWHE